MYEANLASKVSYQNSWKTHLQSFPELNTLKNYTFFGKENISSRVCTYSKLYQISFLLNLIKN